jgi:hypothetical protein
MLVWVKNPQAIYEVFSVPESGVWVYVGSILLVFIMNIISAFILFALISFASQFAVTDTRNPHCLLLTLLKCFALTCVVILFFVFVITNKDGR